MEWLPTSWTSLNNDQLWLALHGAEVGRGEQVFDHHKVHRLALRVQNDVSSSSEAHDDEHEHVHTPVIISLRLLSYLPHHFLYMYHKLTNTVCYIECLIRWYTCYNTITTSTNCIWESVKPLLRNSQKVNVGHKYSLSVWTIYCLANMASQTRCYLFPIFNQLSGWKLFLQSYVKSKMKCSSVTNIRMTPQAQAAMISIRSLNRFPTISKPSDHV